MDVSSIMHGDKMEIINLASMQFSYLSLKLSHLRSYCFIRWFPAAYILSEYKGFYALNN